MRGEEVEKDISDETEGPDEEYDQFSISKTEWRCRFPVPNPEKCERCADIYRGRVECPKCNTNKEVDIETMTQCRNCGHLSCQCCSRIVTDCYIQLQQ